MTEHEEFYTKEELHHFNLSDSEIESLTGHGLGDGEEPSNEGGRNGDKVRRIDHKNGMRLIDGQITIDEITLNKVPIVFYPTDDPGEMYKTKNISKESKGSLLLEETPLKDRRYLKKGATIERKSDNQNYRRGYTQEELIAKRLPENKTIKGEKNFLYMVLNTVNYGYRDRKGEWHPFVAEPGETFYAPVKSENNEKREKILNRKK
ncbi:MAG: hypothetical protein PHE32_02815 [Candidatus Shapirobacteria bacterium]|nr:hypothetical protein [Candidatus Shapirobacteria bacterium]MDD4410605.1 hypothetical protein [Candidatus Shapirobacteria bacterium]